MSDFIGGITVKRGDGAETEAFNKIMGLFSLGGFGKTNPLVRVTDFDSQAEEYIAGLADGDEISMEFNEDLDPATNAQLEGLKSDVDDKINRNIQIVLTDGVNTATFTFEVVPLSWKINPSFEDKNTIAFSLKISGAITES